MTTELLGSLALGTAAGVPIGTWLAGRLARRRGAGPAAPTDPPTSSDQLGRDRDVLRDGVVEVRDLLTSGALRDRLGGALAAAGITELAVPPGTPFDPAHHLAVEAVATDDRDLDGRVAATDRCGYEDRGLPIRPPSVLVYRHEVTDGRGART